MQEQRDDLDIIIENSNSNFLITENYNATLLNKIQQQRHKKYTFEIFNFNNSPLKVTAVSFIFGGIIIGLLSVPVIQYKLVDLQYKVRNAEAFLQYNYNDNFIEYFKGD
ncbi:MAG: hypothetical protein H7Y18_16130 [Clostridiaceae bacterium]|nr:hypothetical protein [Clostridiaceae bacterium]